MKLFQIVIATMVAFLITLQTPQAFAKDKEYKFSVKGHNSKEITDNEDFAMLKASEYTIKKGYEFFTIENIRRYEKQSRMKGRIGGRNPSKSTKRTELKIHCYDAASAEEGALNAATVMADISKKYTN